MFDRDVPFFDEIYYIQIMNNGKNEQWNILTLPVPDEPANLAV